MSKSIYYVRWIHDLTYKLYYIFWKYISFKNKRKKYFSFVVEICLYVNCYICLFILVSARVLPQTETGRWEDSSEEVLGKLYLPHTLMGSVRRGKFNLSSNLNTNIVSIIWLRRLFRSKFTELWKILKKMNIS